MSQDKKDKTRVDGIISPSGSIFPDTKEGREKASLEWEKYRKIRRTRQSRKEKTPEQRVLSRDEVNNLPGEEGRVVVGTIRLVVPARRKGPEIFFIYEDEYEAIADEFKKNKEAYSKFLESCEIRKKQISGDKEAGKKIGIFVPFQVELDKILFKHLPQYGNAFHQIVLEKLLRDHGVLVNWAGLRNYDE